MKPVKMIKPSMDLPIKGIPEKITTADEDNLLGCRIVYWKGRLSTDHKSRNGWRGVISEVYRDIDKSLRITVEYDNGKIQDYRFDALANIKIATQTYLQNPQYDGYLWATSIEKDGLDYLRQPDLSEPKLEQLYIVREEGSDYFDDVRGKERAFEVAEKLATQVDGPVVVYRPMTIFQKTTPIQRIEVEDQHGE